MNSIASIWLGLSLSLSGLLSLSVQSGAIAQALDSSSDSVSPASSNPASSNPASPSPASPAEQLDLDPALMQDSPVLRRWLQEVPNVLSDIHNDPSFRTRLRLGYSYFPSQDASGINVGVEDVFLGSSGFTASADYQAAFKGDRQDDHQDNHQAYGAELRYYVLPLGDRVNLAPTVGYRNVESDRFSSDGVTVGARLMFSLSRTGAADIAVAQSFVAPGSSHEVGITALSLGYALTPDFRLSTDFQTQNTRKSKDDRVGISLEWMP
jgi:hypothetical protein